MDELADYRAKHRHAYLQRKRNEENKAPNTTSDVINKQQIRSPPSTASAPPPSASQQTYTTSTQSAAPSVHAVQPKYTSTTTTTTHHYPSSNAGPTSHPFVPSYTAASSASSSYVPSVPQAQLPSNGPTWFPAANRVPTNAPVVGTTSRPPPVIPQRLTAPQSIQAQIEADERLARQLADQTAASETVRPPDNTFKETLIESGRPVHPIPAAVRTVMPPMGAPQQPMQPLPPRRVIGNAYGPPPTTTFATRTVSPGDAPTYRNAQYSSSGTPSLLNRSPLRSGESDTLHTPSPIASDEDEQMQAAAYASLAQHPR